MARESMFLALNAKRIAQLISSTRERVCYVAPGVHLAVADSLCDAWKRLPTGAVDVSVDVDERVLRMGYGQIEAVERLRVVGVKLRHSPGLRTAVLIVDDHGFVFTPTALYLEREPQSDETPNAIRLSPEQMEQTLIRLSPGAHQLALQKAQSTQEREAIEATIIETGTLVVQDNQVKAVQNRLEAAPPANFDVARQVQVYTAYIQYVEISLTGAAIERRRIQIPEALQSIGDAKKLKGKLKTTFDLIDKESALSSKHLEDELATIRKNLTRSLGKHFGRVVLRAVIPILEKRINALRDKVNSHKEKLQTKLQNNLNKSKQQVANYYFPLVKETPPDAMIGTFPSMRDDEIRAFIDSELSAVFPSAEHIAQKMELRIDYKDVTYSTLNQKEFLEQIRAAYPQTDWDRAHEEFTAVGEANLKICDSNFTLA